jgi:cell division protein FtsW
MFIGGTKLIHIGMAALVGVLGVAAFMLYKVQSGQLSYIMKRVNSFLYPFNEEYAADTWQTRNSLIAIGSGGFVGMGLGNSRQKFLYLPESKNDFVFAIVCEELGFIGALFVVALFVFFIIRGFTIAVRATDKAGMLVACGITMHIGIQALLNIAVVSNAIPNTGVSLPFFSYGGTALIMQLCEMGVLLNISRHVVQVRPNRQRRENMQNAPDTAGEP